MGERLLCKQEVVGSIPSGSTIVFDNRKERADQGTDVGSLCLRGLFGNMVSVLVFSLIRVKTSTTLLKIVNMILAFID